MKNLLARISQQSNLSNDLIQEIEHCFELVEYKKGETILTQGYRANYLYFVKEGVLHNFYFQDAKQITSWFYVENQFITSWSSFYTQKPSFESIECLEDVVLYRIKRSDYQKLIDRFPAFNHFARSLAEQMLSFLDEFSKGWGFLTSQERYLLLKQYFPKIELRVKLGYIASFIGVSQETLSRLRAKN